jgi:hypothetical protein
MQAEGPVVATAHTELGPLGPPTLTCEKKWAKRLPSGRPSTKEKLYSADIGKLRWSMQPVNVSVKSITGDAGRFSVAGEAVTQGL